MQYHYTDEDNRVFGPVGEDELHALYHGGSITAETNVLPEGTNDWRPYRSLSALPPPPPRKTVSASIQSHVSQAPAERVAVATQNCPFCAEDISVNAKKCKHCGEILDFALRAAEEAKRSNSSPTVYMNAGGGAAAAAASRPQVLMVGNRKSGFVAAFLNLLIPGLGYMYCGRVLLGVFVLGITVVLVPLTAGVAALVLYPMFIIDGFLAAGRANRRMVVVG